MHRGPSASSYVDVLIGELVHSAMWHARVTQAELARALGVAQGSVSRRLRGQIAWKVTEVIIVAELLGVPLSELIPD